MQNPVDAVPVIVTGTGWTWTAVFGAVQTGITIVFGSAGVVALIRVWPRLYELMSARRKGDLDDMRQRISDLERKVEEATAAALNAKMQMTYVTAALGMVSAELERRDPGNPVIKSARDLVAQATHDEPPFGGLVRQLDKIKEAEA